MPKKFDTPQQFVQWNEAMAQKYDPDAYHTRSNFFIRWIEKRRVSAIVDFLKTAPGEKVLEVGCGAGNVLEQIPAGALFGVDLSTYLLQKSRQRLGSQQVALLQADAQKLPFSTGKFQKVFCTEVLEHVINPGQVIKEIVRVSCEDAIIVISVPNEAMINRLKNFTRILGLGRILLREKKTGEEYVPPIKMTDEWHLHEFDLHYLENLMDNTLQIMTVQAVPHRLLPVRYVVCCQRVK